VPPAAVENALVPLSLARFSSTKTGKDRATLKLWLPAEVVTLPRFTAAEAPDARDPVQLNVVEPPPFTSHVISIAFNVVVPAFLMVTSASYVSPQIVPVGESTFRS
jgi:hypothetical protein